MAQEDIKMAVQISILETKMDHLKEYFEALAKVVSDHMKDEELQRIAIEKKITILIYSILFIGGMFSSKDIVLKLLTGIL